MSPELVAGLLLVAFMGAPVVLLFAATRLVYICPPGSALVLERGLARRVVLGGRAVRAPFEAARWLDLRPFEVEVGTARATLRIDGADLLRNPALDRLLAGPRDATVDAARAALERRLAGGGPDLRRHLERDLARLGLALDHLEDLALDERGARLTPAKA